MAIVYVVTKGCYSDYHICAVTLDKEKAERLCKLFDDGGMDEAGIEEWDTEDTIDLLSGRKPYYVRFYKNGELISANEDKHCIEYFSPGIKESSCFVQGRKIDSLDVNLYAVDKESAIKIAAEKRAKYLAEKEGIA